MKEQNTTNGKMQRELKRVGRREWENGKGGKRNWKKQPNNRLTWPARNRLGSPFSCYFVCLPKDQIVLPSPKWSSATSILHTPPASLIIPPFPFPPIRHLWPYIFCVLFIRLTTSRTNFCRILWFSNCVLNMHKILQKWVQLHNLYRFGIWS